MESWWVCTRIICFCCAFFASLFVFLFVCLLCVEGSNSSSTLVSCSSKRATQRCPIRWRLRSHVWSLSDKRLSIAWGKFFQHYIFPMAWKISVQKVGLSYCLLRVFSSCQTDDEIKTSKWSCQTDHNNKCLLSYHKHFYFLLILLMEGILHHLGYINPVNDGMDYLATGAGFLPSTLLNRPQYEGATHQVTESSFVCQISYRKGCWNGWHALGVIPSLFRVQHLLEEADTYCQQVCCTLVYVVHLVIDRFLLFLSSGHVIILYTVMMNIPIWCKTIPFERWTIRAGIIFVTVLTPQPLDSPDE